VVAGLATASVLWMGCSSRDETGIVPLEGRWFSGVRVIGSRGVAPGQFNKPRSLVCDRDDNLYVSDITGRIQKFDRDGKFVLQWQMPQTDLGKPKGMGLDPQGNVLVVEPHYMRVNHFATDGRLVAQWGSKGTNEGQFILPRSIGVTSRGEYLLSEYTLVDRVQRFSPFVPATNGAPAALPRFVQAWGGPGPEPGRFNRAEGLGIGPSDTVFVADSCNHRIQVFDSAGKFLRQHGTAGSAPGQFGYPYDIRVDAGGNQFVCEFGNSRISILDAGDRPVEIVGGPGSAPGRFSNPWAIALDSRGNLYVADSQNHRVQKLIRRDPPARGAGRG
jgi:DNA-binding beta-propeller fold protein YncE